MERTYVFDNNGGNECGGGMMGLIANLCQNRGMDPNAVLAMMNNRNNNGFGGEGGWFMWVIFLFFLMGWGGNGWGGFGNRGGQGEGNFLAGQLANDTGRELLQQAINGNGQAISQLASTLNCDINAIQTALNGLSTQLCQLGNTIGLGQRDIIQQILLGNQNIASQLASCCCDIRSQIADFKGDIALQMCQQTNTLSNGQRDLGVAVTKGFCDTAYATREQTCELKNAIEAQSRLMVDKFSQLEMREMQRENQSLRDRLAKCELSDSQRAQTAEIINTVRPCPTPAFITCNPWASNGNYYGYGYNPYGNGCGCGNNNSCGCGCGCN